MVARIGQWIELSFWHTAVQVLSGFRPLSRGFDDVTGYVQTRPAFRFLPRGWMIALIGWIVGLSAGILIATWWF